jgi:hypothetical protein
MSDTPETDEKASPHIGFFSCATVPAEFARQLERERDEARELARQMSESNQVLLADVRFYRNAWEQLKKEKP